MHRLARGIPSHENVPSSLVFSDFVLHARPGALHRRKECESIDRGRLHDDGERASGEAPPPDQGSGLRDVQGTLHPTESEFHVTADRSGERSLR